MRITKNSLLCAGGAVAIAALLAACGSGNSTVLPSNVRVVNLLALTASNSSTDAITLTLNTNAYGVSTAPQSASGYIQVTPSTYTAEVQTVGDLNITSAPYLGLGLATNQYYTVFAYSRAGALYPFVLVDNVGTPATGVAQLTIANASPDVGAVDVYLTPHTSSSPTDACSANLVTPAFASVQGQQTSAIPFTVLSSTATQITYDVCVTAAGSPTDPRLSLTGANGLTMASGTNYVLALTTSSGGALLDGALIPQTNPATITLLSNPQFRIRAISASTTVANPAVVTVGSTSLPGIYPSVWTPYTPVTLGASQPTVSVSIGGTVLPLTLPAGFAFTEGSDYTVLVYTTGAGDTATLLTDDNRYVLGKAKVRLINGGDTQPLSMVVNGVANINTINVAEGAASGYAPVDGGADVVRLQSADVNSATAGQPFTTDFISGGVYTVLMTGTGNQPIAITDR
jgi:hypothetical protein